MGCNHCSCRWDVVTVAKLGGSYIIPMGAFVIIRVVACLFWTAFLAFGVYDYIDNDHGLFVKYFTNISFILLVIWYVLAIYFSFLAWRHPDTWNKDPEGYEKYFWPFSWVFHSLVFCNALTATLVYWTLLDPTPNAYSYVSHGINSIYLVSELAFSKLGFVLGHFWFVFGFAMAYMVFGYIWFAATDEFIYGFLDYNDSLYVVYIIGIPLGVFLIFMIGMGIAQLRNKFLWQKFFENDWNQTHGLGVNSGEDIEMTRK